MQSLKPGDVILMTDGRTSCQYSAMIVATKQAFGHTHIRLVTAGPELEDVLSNPGRYQISEWLRYRGEVKLG